MTSSPIYAKTVQSDKKTLAHCLYPTPIPSGRADLRETLSEARCGMKRVFSFVCESCHFLEHHRNSWAW